MDIWGFIYAYAIDGRGNIGYTTNLKKRFWDHLGEKKANQHFHNSLRKNFKSGDFRIIEAHHKSIEELKQILPSREVFWIAELDTYDLQQIKGWNLTRGGDGWLGGKHTETTIEQMKKDRKGRGFWRGKNFLPTHRSNLSLAHIGNCPTDTTIAKMSAASIGVPKTEKHRQNISIGSMGKKMSLESRLLMSAKKKGKTPWNKGRKCPRNKKAQPFD